MEADKQTLKQTIVLGIFFVLLVTTYTSFSNIITFIYENDSKQYPYTGTLSLILNYVVYLFGLTWAASLTNFKRQFQIAAICYTLNYALYLLDLSQLVRLIISIIGAIIGGYGASVLWVSQGGYMVRLFKLKGIQQAAEGKYIGVMNGIVFSNLILGGILTTFALGLFGNEVYFIILSVIGVLSYFLCKIYLDPLQDSRSVTIVPNQVRNISFTKQLKQIIKYYPKMKYLIFAMILDGFFTAFIATNFSEFLPVPFKTNFNVGLLHISNGIGAILGGYISGFLSDKIPPLKQGVILFTLTTLVLLITTFNVLLTIQALTFPLVITFIWGVVFSFLQGWLFVCCVKINNGETQSFAVVKQMHTLSFIVFQIYVIITGGKINFFGTIIVLLLLSVISGVICFIAQKRRSGLDELCQEKVGQCSPQL